MKTSVLLIILYSLSLSQVIGQKFALPQNPLKGQLVFEDKRCIECHAIRGYGGTVAPDLSVDHFYGSFLELAAIIWNHIPQMDREYRKLKVQRPTFSEDEMLNLIGFIYYLRYLGEPGSVSKGKRLLNARGCLKCHDQGSLGNHIGPDLLQMSEFGSPLSMVQAMWNHGPSMMAFMKEMELNYPALSGSDITNISVYLHQISKPFEAIRMTPGNPVKGKDIFLQKKCNDCHSIENKSKTVGTDLTGLDLRKSVSDIAASMWNHGPTMMDIMKNQAIEWPRFYGDEMADLIAYLYFLSFEDKPGNPKKGEQIFSDKGCLRCHESGGDGEGPDLSKMKRFNSPIRMIQLMWNHAPKMEDLILILNESWPELSANELRDLYAYLKKISIKAAR